MTTRKRMFPAEGLCGGSGSWEDEANKWGRLKSHAIANFIQCISQFIFWGLKGVGWIKHTIPRGSYMWQTRHTAKTCLSKEVYKQIMAASCSGYCNEFSLVNSLLSIVPGRNIKQIPTTIPCLGETKITRLLLCSSGIFSQTLRNLIRFCSWTMFLALNYWQLTDVMRGRKVSSFQKYGPW